MVEGVLDGAIGVRPICDAIEMRLARAIGYAVRQERLRQRMTQEELAERADVARFTVTSIEGGTAPTIATLQKVARGLGMTASLLLSQAEIRQKQ